MLLAGGAVSVLLRPALMRATMVEVVLSPYESVTVVVNPSWAPIGTHFWVGGKRGICPLLRVPGSDVRMVPTFKYSKDHSVHIAVGTSITSAVELLLGPPPFSPTTLKRTPKVNKLWVIQPCAHPEATAAITPPEKSSRPSVGSALRSICYPTTVCTSMWAYAPCS